MRKAWTPSIVPAGTDQNIYLVMDDLAPPRSLDKAALSRPILLGDLGNIGAPMPRNSSPRRSPEDAPALLDTNQYHVWHAAAHLRRPHPVLLLGSAFRWNDGGREWLLDTTSLALCVSQIHSMAVSSQPTGRAELLVPPSSDSSL
jgi:hypothetical protein